MYHEGAGIPLVLAAPDRRRRARRPHRLARRESERVRILGETVDLVRPEEVMFHVEAWVEDGRKAVVANHNLRSLYRLRRGDAVMRRFYDRADLVELDSSPLVLFGRMLGLSARPFHRCSYLNWRDHFWSVADRKGWRVFYLGGAPGVADRASGALSKAYPRTLLAQRDGCFGVEGPENEAVVEQIAAFQPDILFVGLGAPHQENWIARNLERLPDCVIVAVGDAFTRETGARKTAQSPG